MIISEITLSGFRGFREALSIKLSPSFTVISGRNGVGKSTIIDAIEFALQGKLSKYLINKTGGDSINEYIWWKGDAPAEQSFTKVTFTDGSDEEVSIGDYVLTGGEIPTMAIVDSITRLLPGVLGNIESAKDESHSTPGLLEYPQYTRPEIFEANNKKYRTPKVLLSGNHKKIEEWKEEHKKHNK